MEVLLMIRLFKSTETDFTHNEYILNEIVSCKVSEELNGDYTLELEYPLEDSKNISSNLIVGAIISVPTIDNRPDQLFRIIDKETTSSTIIVQAQAKLLADLKTNWSKGMTIAGKTRKEAIQQILGSCLESHVYVVGNLDTNVNRNVILNTKTGNPLTVIIGSDDESIINVYGGELIVNNNTFDLIDHRGIDNGVIVEYGKNIKSIKESINTNDLTTVLVPKSGDVYLPEYFIESSNVSKYEKRYFKEVDLNLNIWDGTGTQGDGQITKTQAYALMRDACSKMFNADKVDLLAFNYSIDFIELSKTEEYKNYAILETVNVGDTVIVRHKILNLDLQGRVNKITYIIDSEGNKTIDTVEIGFARKSITDIINSTIRNIQFAEQKILLQVSNLDNTLTSKIEITAGQIRSEVSNTASGLQSQITQTASEIRSEVTNTASGLQSQITQQAGQISSTVTRVGEAESNITQLADDITSKVSKGDFSSLIQQNAQAVAIAIKGETDMNVVFDSNGQLIKNGALEVQDSSGRTLLYFDNTKGILGTRDISIGDTSKGSGLYNALMSMDECYIPNLGVGTLYINDKSVEQIVYDMLVEYNLV
jgi:phage minor structural protein